MINITSLRKYGLLGSLYMSQYLPIAFFTQALPVFLRQQKASLEAIGLLSFLALPWMLRFLWSPPIDRYGRTKWGHYKFWIVLMQILLVLATCVCALPQLQTNFSTLLIVVSFICFFAATQDIATDALAVGLLATQERGIGNSIQIAGSCLGTILGAGGLLILLSRWGWTTSMLAMASCLMLAIVPVMFYQERIQARSISSKNPLANYLQSFVGFLRRPGIISWLGLMVLNAVGIGCTTTMFRPLLVDVGLSLAEIGLLTGIVSNVAAIVGTLMAGLVMTRWGRKRSLIGFGMLEVVAIALHLLPAFGLTSLPVLYLVAIAFQIAFSMTLTVFYSLMMDSSRLEAAGTDFSLQVSILMIGGLGTAGFSGFVANAVGYAGLFAISAGVCLVSVLMLAKVFDEGKFPVTTF